MRKYIAPNQRLAIYNKCEGKCCYCGKDIEPNKFQVDHFYPVSYSKYMMDEYGYDICDERNLMPSCRNCNHYKRADTPDNFRTKIKSIHERIINQYITRVGVDFGVVNISPFDGLFYFEKHPCVGVKYPNDYVTSLIKE